MEELPSYVLVIFDGAYSHFVTADDYSDGLELVRLGYPIVVTQTFSKIYGLAGIRVGYGIASPSIRLTQAWPIMKRVAIISSGAGKKPYPGWGAYCTAKAGLDMLTRCVGVEQMNQPHPVEIYSIAPGVVDTDMQREIRAAEEVDFPQVSRFVQLKEQGELQSPEATAQQLIHLLQTNAFEQGEIADLRTKKP
ncbi:unnamed protein product, partial [marine sediment metagenome]